MTQTPVNIGQTANSGAGDSLRDAFAKLNANDADLNTRLNALAQLVCTPSVLATLIASLPRTLPSQPGQLWVNGNILAIS